MSIVRMKRSSRFLKLFLSVVLLTSGLIVFSPPHTVEAADEFDAMRMKRFISLVGDGTYSTSDPDIAAQIALITDTANTHWSTLITSPTRASLWSDLASWGSSATMASSYIRIKAMALAYKTVGSALYGNTSLESDIISALEWMYTNKYNPSKGISGNWWNWEIGTPQLLNDTMVLMYDHLSETQISNYVSAIDRFVPNPARRSSGVTETGANLLDKILIVSLRGVLGKSSAKIIQGRNATSLVFPYVLYGDGFYEDGSFIQHYNVPYIGGYGLNLIRSLSGTLNLLNGSTWAVTDPKLQNVWNWISDSFQPFIYKGAMMEMVKGRGFGTDDHWTGRATIINLLRLTEGMPLDKELETKRIIKQWVQDDTTFANYYNDTEYSINEIVKLKAIMNDSSIVPIGELTLNKMFPNMARAVHLQPGFGFGLSLFSNRITAFEYGNGDNPNGWFEGLGMTYLYNNDLNQFTNFGKTINMRRLPGTTTDGSGSGTPGGFKLYPNSKTWVGGSSLNGNLGSVGMDFSLSLVTGSPLEGKKSWFMYGDKIIALGAGITNTNNKNVETIVENRRLKNDGSNTLTVEGITKSSLVGWTETMSNVQWAHLSGNVSGSDIGYYFPDTANLYGVREARTSSGTAPVTDNYLSLAVGHGTNPTNAGYAYVLLPNKDEIATANYASNPDIAILENSTDMQAVRDTSLNVVGANFWNDVTKTLSVDGSSFITSDKKASVTTQERLNEIDIAVSDPTQANTGTINLEIHRSASGVLALDPGITITQYSPTIKLSIDVNGSRGKSFTAKFVTGAPVVPEAPSLSATASHTQVVLEWPIVGGEIGYNVKYGTVPGVYPNEVNIPNVIGKNSFTATGLTNELPYYFVITAYNDAGESGNSIEISATPSDKSAYWGFDEGTGTIASDSWGSNQGTINGAVRTTDSITGEALYFNGMNSSVDIGATDISGSWTAAMWVKRQDSPAGNSILMEGSTSTLALEQWNNSNKVGFTKKGVADYTFNYTAPVDIWVHLTFVGTGSGTSLYVNGTLLQSLAGVIDCPMGKIGAWDSQGYLKGTLDDVKIFNRALMASEISDLASAPTSINQIAYWDFDEGAGTIAADTWNSFQGTINGAAWTTNSISGEALYFNGTNSSVDIGTSDITGPWTAAMWVRREDSSAGNSILMSGSSSSLALEQWNNSNKVGFTKQGVADYTFNYSAPVDIWVHLTFVGSSSGTSLYVNGVLFESNAAVINGPMGKIGAWGTQGYLKGTLDEVKIFNRTLNASEISDLASAPTSVNQIAYWGFDEGVGTIASNTWGSTQGAINGAVWTTDSVSGEALYFNGTNSSVDIGAADITGPWTAAMWVKRQDSSVGNSILMGGSNSSLALEQWNNTNKVGFTKRAVADYTFNYTAPVDTWVHLTFVGSSSGTSLYVNGVLLESNAAVIDCPMGNIGAWGTVGYLKGTLDDVKIFNRALTQGEITELAS
jgi:hyaluronate lyase